MYPDQIYLVLLYLGYTTDDYQLGRDDLGNIIIAQWYHADPVPTLAEVNAALLPALQEHKIEQLKTEAVRRMAMVNQSFVSFDFYLVIRALYKSGRDSVKANAQAVVALDPLLVSIDEIADAGINARDVINAMTDPALVDIYDYVDTPAWP